MTADDAMPTLTLEAADWFARKRSGKMTAEDLQALQAWLAAGPDHVAAFEEVAGAWGIAGALRSDPEILGIRERARRAGPTGRRAVRAGAVAASLAVVVLTGWSVLGQNGYVPAPMLLTGGEQTFRTGLGQTATMRLRDGSIVTLDTDTVLRARQTDDRRMLRLARGQAYFQVAKDMSRPFTVAAGDKLVTATGTAFTVRLEKKAVEVTLVEGNVRVEEAAPAVPLSRKAPRTTGATEMDAGSKLVAVADSDWRLDRVDTGKATSWLGGQLIFEDRPLAEAAAEMNRYSAKKIVIRDPAIGAARIVSVVKAGDVEGFVRVLTTSGFARVVTNTEDAVELAAPTEKNDAMVGQPAA